MCMLCVVPPNVIPSRSKLENSALNNPHGFGFAIVVPEDNRIIMHRTMDADEAVNKFIEMRGKYPEGYAMWHARLATHGSQTIENCHPFPVGHDTQTYLAHNGILPVLEDGTDRSDTRIFAEDILRDMGGVTALDNEQIFNIIEDFTAGSKICVLTVDPRAQYQCYLIHEEKGKKDESGVWWSNDSCYLSSSLSLTSNSAWTPVKPYAHYNGYFEEEDGIVCFNCKEPISSDMLDLYDGSCFYCGGCQDCVSTQDNCLCRRPVKKETYSSGAWDLW